jgi:hypothetical protein
LLVVHFAAQSCVVASHVYGTQIFASPGMHAPLPSHD